MAVPRALWGFCLGFRRVCNAECRQRLQSFQDESIWVGVWSNNGQILRYCEVFLNADCAQYSRRDAIGTAGGEPGATMSIVMGVGERCRRHEVSILIACGTGDARCWGCWPRRKVSMMRMGPPQQGQGCSGAFGCSGVVSRALMASTGINGAASSSRMRAMLRARDWLLRNP